MYAKFYIALSALLAFLAVAAADGDLTLAEGLQGAVVLLGALGVRQVPNIPSSPLDGHTGANEGNAFPRVLPGEGLGHPDLN